MSLPPEITQYRQSCKPNVKVLITHTEDYVVYRVQATEDMDTGTEAQRPFDENWLNAKEPLFCAIHNEKGEQCPFETVRLAYQAGMENKK